MLSSRFRRHHGFTLIELIVVIAIGVVVVAVVAAAIGWSRAYSRQALVTAKKKAFESQILLNSAAGVAWSPFSHDGSAWQPRWFNNARASNLVFAVQIDQALIHAAVEANLHDKSPPQKERARDQLEKRFLRNNQRTFLISVGSTCATAYHRDWKLSVGSIKDRLEIVPLTAANGVGTVVDADLGVDGEILAGQNPRSALVFVQDTVAANDPSFTLRIKGLTYSIRDNNNRWHYSASPSEITLRFETANVKLMAMLEQGTPWSQLESAYVTPKRSVSFQGLEQRVVDELLGFVVKVGISALLAAL